ncbi:hypothetical protein DKL51_05840 [Micromonospora globispora]|nr:hypothetical protein DKL51_05840 [Micromonospora globispora]
MAPARPEGPDRSVEQERLGLPVEHRQASRAGRLGPAERSTSTPREMSLATISPLYQYVDHWLDRMS